MSHRSLGVWASVAIALLVLVLDSQHGFGQQARELTREEQFFRAIRAGNVAAVQQFIDDGIDVDTRDSSGSPAIVLAAGYQQPEVVLLLIRAKADVNAKQRGRGSALHEAAHRGLTGAVRELIKAGADVNAEVFGQDPTPLHCAADINDVEIVKILIAAGAKVDSGSMTPLTRACRAAKGNKTAAIQALIDAKANLNPEDDSPLHWARSPAVIKLLIAAGADVNHRNKGQETPLHLSFAPHWGHKEDEVRLLIDAGGDVNARDKNNTTPLHNAVLNDYPKIVRMLIDAGADLDARDNFGNTPFSLAERIKSAEIDQLLKAAGADDGLTSLARAVRAGDPRQVQSLLATGVDVNEHGPEGKTALHLACDLDSIDVAYVLIAAEASLDARDAGNLTPLHWRNPEAWRSSWSMLAQRFIPGQSQNWATP